MYRVPQLCQPLLEREARIFYYLARHRQSNFFPLCLTVLGIIGEFLEFGIEGQRPLWNVSNGAAATRGRRKEGERERKKGL